jgi:hypothetical protein
LRPYPLTQPEALSASGHARPVDLQSPSDQHAGRAKHRRHSAVTADNPILYAARAILALWAFKDVRGTRGDTHGAVAADNSDDDLQTTTTSKRKE